MKRTLYFAYGSNLDPTQMRRRCPHAAATGCATLDGYRIAFGGHSRTWGGAVATLVQDPDEWADGVLYEMPVAELAMLDRHEGHPRSYRRTRLLVTDAPARHRRGGAAPARPRVPASRWRPRRVLWDAYLRLGFDRTPLAVARGGVR